MGVGVLPLSGSTNGQPVLLAAGANLIHTAAASVTTTDQIYVWFCNSTGAECRVDIYFGAYDAANLFTYQYLVPPNSRMKFLTPGFILNNGMLVYAEPSSPSVVTVAGFAVRFLTGT